MKFGDQWMRRRAPVKRPAAPTVTLHGQGADDWGLERDALDFLETLVRHDTVSAETGAGLSTLLLARLGAAHTVVTPSEDEVSRIRAECSNAGISLERVRFVVGRSEVVLPGMDLPPLDLAIIDGGHGMPVPFVDWCYLAPRIKVGGVLLVDDTQIWTSRTLTEFLRAEWSWDVIGTFRKAVAFRKTAETILTDWGGQPFVAARSAPPEGWPWWNNAIRGHVAGIDGVLEEIERLGAASADSIRDLQWVEGEMLDCVRRIEGICARKATEP